jgi:hypothetical protein
MALGLSGIRGISGPTGGRVRSPQQGGLSQYGGSPASTQGGGYPTGGGAVFGGAPQQQRRYPMARPTAQGPDTMSQLRSGLSYANLANKGYEWLSGSPTGLGGGLGMAGGVLGGAAALGRVAEGNATPMDYVTLAKLGYNAYGAATGAGAGAGAGATGAGAGAGGAGAGMGVMAGAALPLAAYALSEQQQANEERRAREGASRTLGRYEEWGINPNQLFSSSMSDPWAGTEAQKKAALDYVRQQARNPPDRWLSEANYARGLADKVSMLDRSKMANYISSLPNYKGPIYTEDFYHDLTGDLLQNSSKYGLNWSDQLNARRAANESNILKFMASNPELKAIINSRRSER